MRITCLCLMFGLGMTLPAQAKPGPMSPPAASASSQPFASSAPRPLKEDPHHVRRWRAFYQALVQLHESRLARRPIHKSSVSGGYANLPDFYIETTYVDTEHKQVVSRIRYEKARPGQIHTIEVYIYDDQGQLQRDYLAAWLPHFRNAPVQTLINLHSPDPELKAYRQFDANGTRIYEQCQGPYFDKTVSLSLEEDELPDVIGAIPVDINPEIYTACFNAISVSVDNWLNPLAEIRQASGTASSPVLLDHKDDEIDKLTRMIDRSPKQAGLYVQRGDRYFEIRQFEHAIHDYTTALALDDGQDRAWFGRGMARGRAGQLSGAIADLDIYLRRHPDDARAWTKRGVRHIWLGKLPEAERDFRTALRLAPGDAEAHDDLGVIHAQRGEFGIAIGHFRQTIRLDPSYQKGHHNLATAYYLTGKPAAALQVVDTALRLRGDARNSVLLKGEILQRLGRKSEAEELFRQAAQLPEGNWSENWAVMNEE